MMLPSDFFPYGPALSCFALLSASPRVDTLVLILRSRWVLCVPRELLVNEAESRGAQTQLAEITNAVSRCGNSLPLYGYLAEKRTAHQRPDSSLHHPTSLLAMH